MSRQANGTYIQPANTAAISGQAISGTAFNTLITDIGAEITNSLDRQGRSAMQAALPMGNNKITGLATPTTSTDGATKNYVDTVTATFFGTGDIKATLKTVADAGWLLFDDGTFGNVGSGSSNRENADTQALFTLLFNNVSDSAAPLLTSGGGATTRSAQTNAATAWVANCRMTLPKALGRVFASAGAGGGLTSRPLGSSVGEESHLLALAEIPTGLTSSGTNAISVSGPSTGNMFTIGISGTGSAIGSGPTNGNINNTTAFNGSNVISVTSNNTGGAAHNNMQPTVFVNWMVKL